MRVSRPRSHVCHESEKAIADEISAAISETTASGRRTKGGTVCEIYVINVVVLNCRVVKRGVGGNGVETAS